MNWIKLSQIRSPSVFFLGVFSKPNIRATQGVLSVVLSSLIAISLQIQNGRRCHSFVQHEIGWFGASPFVFPEAFQLSMDKVNHPVESLELRSQSPKIATPRNNIDTEHPQRLILKFDVPKFHGVDPHGWIFKIT